ncbi:MAG: site-specific DNA-methyltransferase [Candidatus Aenigmarchaeota archaeon]|nr:site-specific DNA-methyltransferase [Candidatus Aenigmarchaeota archaeon]
MISTQFKLLKGKKEKFVPKVIIGDIRDAIKELPDNFIDCVITSPPYWKQRDYGHPKQIGQESTWQEYVKNIADIFNALAPKLKSTATVFLNVGYKFLDKQMILIPEAIAMEMERGKFLLRNKIIWYKPNFIPSPASDRLANAYEPILFFIKKEGKDVYYLNLKALSKKSKTLEDFLQRVKSLKPEDYLGIRVKDTLRSRKKKEGVVKGVGYVKNKVKKILVEWKEDGEEWIELEELTETYPKEIKFSCPYCRGILTYDRIMLSFANKKELRCPSCGKKLCTSVDNFPIPLTTDTKKEETLTILKRKNVIPKKYLLIKKPENSKFLKTKQLFFASPAGRVIVEGEYFLLKRKYKVPQPLIAHYLRFWKEKRKKKTSDLDKVCGYSHTAGHWLRDDFGEWGKGGSLPRPTDWIKLKEFLKFDNLYDEVMTSTIASLQTIKTYKERKNPGDVWEIKLEQYRGAHFAVFPRELVRRCLLIGCPPKGVVLDPFAGSGTVGEVAIELGRKAILVELIEEFLPLIKERCEEIELIPL